MRFDEKMPETVKKHNARVIVMHMKGTPQDMQKAPFYEDVIRETVEYFDERIDFADKEGIPLENLIIDPGIGFGKRIEDNIRIIKNLSAYRKYGLPLLIGASRKSFIGTLLATDHGEPLPPEKRLFGTLGIHAAACMNGADILRVHDVKEHRDMLKMINYIK
jgi:dihydropteroate synthase